MWILKHTLSILLVNEFVSAFFIFLFAHKLYVKYNMVMDYKNKIKQNIGINLKNLRISKNMSQAELADHLKVSKTTISSYETGERTPSVDMLITISRYFSIEPGVLFSPHLQKDDKSKTINVDGLTKEDIKLLTGLVLRLKK